MSTLSEACPIGPAGSVRSYFSLRFLSLLVAGGTIREKGGVRVDVLPANDQ
jgi:hypothetical protein